MRQMAPRAIDIATGEGEASIARFSGEKQAEINKAVDESAAITAVAESTADAVRKIAGAIREPAVTRPCS